MNRYLFYFFVVILSACSDNELLNLKQISHGAQLYQLHCANCHQEDGSGLARLIPPLYRADFWNHSSQNLPCLIKQGMKGPLRVNGKEYNLGMPAATKLSDAEIADISVYVWQKFPEKPIAFSDSLILRLLKDCSADTIQARAPLPGSH